MNDAALDALVEATTVFAKASPDQQARVIAALQRTHHAGGFLGDRINDGPALKAADVGARSTPPSTSPRSPRTSSCWTRVGRCWPTARSRAAWCLATSPNMSNWAPHRNSGTCSASWAPAVPAHHADPGAYQHPALRLLPDYHRDRPGRQRVTRSAAVLGDQQLSPRHAVHWADQLDLRLCDLRYSDPGVPRLEDPGSVSDRLVRRVLADPDPDCPHHPNREILFFQSRASTALIVITLTNSAVAIAQPFTHWARPWASCPCRRSTGRLSPASSPTTPSSPTWLSLSSSGSVGARSGNGPGPSRPVTRSRPARSLAAARPDRPAR
jgi:hypothetical protein